MRLIEVLNKIHSHRFNDSIPKEAENEVERELLLVRGMLERIIEDNTIGEDIKENEFENVLNFSIANKNTRITHPIALNIIDASCEEAGVKIKIKRP